MGHGASNSSKCKNHPRCRTTPSGVPDYPVQAPPQPSLSPPGYNEPMHVPVSFYPDNVYSTSTGNGVIGQINREIDNFDAQMTEVLDGNRYFNRVHDSSIPPAPGMVVCMTGPLSMQPGSSSQPVYPSQPPPYYNGPAPQQNPPSYANPYPNVQQVDTLPEKKAL